ncbi:MAG: hypothetical protein FD180_3470 [Planctomycetota bacterium]|nr:MAG: hypothetical protein FD180_3470 [Planctomycetota bacterium]
MTRRLFPTLAAAILLLASAGTASAKTYAYDFGDSFGGSTIGGAYAGHFWMENTATSADCEASLAATGTWMGTSYALFAAEYSASQTLGSGTAEATVTYMGSVVYHKSLSKSWKWSWKKSKTVFEKSATFMVFGAPVSVSTDCKWVVDAKMNLALTPTGAGADGSAAFDLKATGSAGVSIPIFSGSLVVKVTVIEVKPKGELEANFSYLHAEGSVKANSLIDLALSVSIFGFSLPPVTFYKEYLYDKTWTWTKEL